MSTAGTRVAQRPALLEYAAAVLGPVYFVGDRSWDHAEAHVIEVTDAEGVGWMVKHCFRSRVFERETAALRDWAPAVGAGRAPELRASDGESQTFITRRLPGTAGVAATPDAFRQGGELTRRLHDSGPTSPMYDLAETVAEQLESWLARMPGVADPADVDYARARLRDFADLPPTYEVRCHNDNQPRNWLVADDGTVAVIDFGKARIGVWLRDLERMYFAEWLGRPELQEAFLDGYGRALSDTDVERLRCMGIGGSIVGRLWAREHHAPDFEQHHIDMLDRIRAGEQ
jgi:aminoglycoside phosphotransferase